MKQVVVTVIAALGVVASVMAGSPDPVWVQQFDGPYHQDDRVVDMCVDDSGNVYVTGISADTFYYWSEIPTYSTIRTVRYNADGSLAWVHRFSGDHTSAEPVAIDLDQAGNILVAGWSWFGGAEKYLLMKLLKTGDTSWIQHYPALDTGGACEDMDVSASGSSVLTGGVNPMECRTVQYDSDGNLIWQNTFHGFVANGWASGYVVKVDAQGFVYVAGTTADPGQYNDLLTIKYDLDGDTVWARRYNGPGNREELPVAVAVDIDGNIFVTGTSRVDPNYPRRKDIVTIKYDPVGNLVWASYHQSSVTPFGQETPVGMDVDNVGNCLVVGWTELDANDRYNWLCIKYTPSGDTAWVRQYDGLGLDINKPEDMGVDASGALYATGHVNRAPSLYDVATVRYHSNGDLLWETIYECAGATSYDAGKALALGGSDSVYVGGYSLSSNMNYLTVKYIPTCCQGTVGNIDGDVGDILDISDLSALVDFLFLGGSITECLKEADIDASCSVDIADLQGIIDHIFFGGLLPQCP